jgi:hypothetical protein
LLSLPFPSEGTFPSCVATEGTKGSFFPAVPSLWFLRRDGRQGRRNLSLRRNLPSLSVPKGRRNLPEGRVACAGRFLLPFGTERDGRDGRDGREGSSLPYGTEGEQASEGTNSAGKNPLVPSVATQDGRTDGREGRESKSKSSTFNFYFVFILNNLYLLFNIICIYYYLI